MYRPTDENIKPLEELDKALKKLTIKNRLPNIILVGDFNPPHVNRNTNSIIKGKNKPQYSKKLNQLLIDIGNNNMLTQVQQKPTRGRNILDLCSPPFPIN